MWLISIECNRTNLSWLKLYNRSVQNWKCLPTKIPVFLLEHRNIINKLSKKLHSLDRIIIIEPNYASEYH